MNVNDSRESTDEQEGVEALEEGVGIYENDADLQTADNQPSEEIRTSENSIPRQSRQRAKTPSPKNKFKRVRKPSTRKNWKSANAFINFMQDYKQEFPDTIMGRNMFQICGERWKSMTDEQKQPYIRSAKSQKKSKYQKVAENSEQLLKKSVSRVTKRKIDTKRKDTTQKKSKANKQDAKSNSDTDTATTTVHSSMSDGDSS